MMEPQRISRVRAMLETHPLRALVFLGILALPLAWCFAFWQARTWERGYVNAAVAAQSEKLRERTERIAEKTAAKFATIHQLTALLASEHSLAAKFALQGVGSRANAHLREIGERLHMHRVLLIDTNGVCVASNESDPRANLVGVSLRDREYVARALQGRSWTQFVVGRVSGVPGIHFSAPVVRRGRVVGVFALKVDLGTLADEMNLSTGFVADPMGVVVISETPDYLLRAVPGSPALSLGSGACQVRYQRDSLKTLPLSMIDVGGRAAYSYGDNPAPQLMQTVKLAFEDLTVYSFEDLSGILDNARQGFGLRLMSAMVGVYLALLLVCCSVIYVLRDRGQKRALNALNQELRELAQHDPLTMCHNRRSFDEMLQQEVRRSDRSSLPFALVLFDLDWFKAVNDTYGHAAGDDVLVSVTRIIRQELRSGDIFARLGGDEFGVLLPGASEAVAAEVMNRVALRLAAAPAAPSAERHLQTLSVGVVAWRPGRTPARLCVEADKALYEAKRLGRNRVVLWSQMPESDA